MFLRGELLQNFYPDLQNIRPIFDQNNAVMVTLTSLPYGSCRFRKQPCHRYENSGVTVTAYPVYVNYDRVVVLCAAHNVLMTSLHEARVC